MEEPDAVLLEVGPGETLSSLARQNAEQGQRQITLSCLRHPQVEKSDVGFLLNTIGRLWLCGIPVNWGSLYKDEQRNRVRLPPYPFERARYWVDPAPPSSANRPLPLKEPDIADWFYVPSWKRTILSSLPAPSETRSPNFIVFADGAGLGHRLIKRLREAGHLVISVLPGTGFAQEDELNYVLNPGRVEDYRALFDRIAGQENGLPRIVHLWTATPRNENESELDSFDRAQQSGFYSILYLAQGLGAREGVKAVRLTVVSAGVHSVTGDEGLDPGRATILGLCRVIPQEHSAIRCFNVDVDITELTESCQGILESLTIELCSSSTDPVVAYRRGHRWVQLYEPVRLAESPAPIHLLRKHGTYLITGGLGNVGFALAEEIAKTCPARLVLIGRSALPAEGDREQWVRNHPEEDPITHKIQRLEALKQLGSEVMAFSADVADEQQMQEVLNLARERFGEIDGVIHGAGETSPDSFPLVYLANRDTCDRHFATKARGLLVLDKLLRGRERDFWVFVSSLSSTLGGLGYAAYSAANNFLDAFAAGRGRNERCHYISINWDGWAFTETQLNAADAGATAALAQQAILPAEGVEAFRRILSLQDVSQIAVSVSCLPARIEKWVKLELLKQENEQQPSVTTHARPALANEYVAPSNEVQQAIAAIWQELLGVEDVGIHDNFFELGGHSLLAIQVISRMRQSFHIELAVDLLFNSPTVAKLADVVQTDGSYTSEEIERISELLDFVDTLSEDEIKALLDDQGEA